MTPLKIYCAGPITGLTGEQVFNHYDNVSSKLRGAGFQVFHPMVGKDHMRTEVGFKSTGHNENPITKDRAIYGRDKWMVKQSDIIFKIFSPELHFILLSLQVPITEVYPVLVLYIPIGGGLISASLRLYFLISIDILLDNS